MTYYSSQLQTAVVFYSITNFHFPKDSLEEMTKRIIVSLNILTQLSHHGKMAERLRNLTQYLAFRLAQWRRKPHAPSLQHIQDPPWPFSSSSSHSPPQENAGHNTRRSITHGQEVRLGKSHWKCPHSTTLPCAHWYSETSLLASV